MSVIPSHLPLLGAFLVIGACTEPSPPFDGGMDSPAAIDAGSDVGPDCPLVALDATAGTLRCGYGLCGDDEACCFRGVERGCVAAACLPRARDYPTSCVDVRECDGTDAMQCAANEGCCVGDRLAGARALRCVPFTEGCSSTWACTVSEGGGSCPPGRHCAVTDLEGGMQCVPDTDGGIDAP